MSVWERMNVLTVSVISSNGVVHHLKATETSLHNVISIKNLIRRENFLTDTASIVRLS